MAFRHGLPLNWARVMLNFQLFTLLFLSQLAQESSPKSLPEAVATVPSPTEDHSSRVSVLEAEREKLANEVAR